jgi:hypothetical protein
MLNFLNDIALRILGENANWAASSPVCGASFWSYGSTSPIGQSAS